MSGKICGRTFALCPGAALLGVQLPALALNGCTDSPENPTAVLALLGAAAGGLRHVLKRHVDRRASQQGLGGQP